MRDLINRTACVVAAVVLFTYSPVQAQDGDRNGHLDLAGHAGSMGLGADVAVLVEPNFGLRASVNFVPFDINFVSDAIDYRLDWQSPIFLLVADFYAAGQFRLDGGLMISPTDVNMTGRLVEPREFGANVYTPDEVGTLSGRVATNSVAPYVGIGFGNPAAHRVGFFADLGVAFHGNPKVTAEADGPVASDPQFRQDLAAEVQELQDDVENIIVYPVLSLGMSFRLGR